MFSILRWACFSVGDPGYTQLVQDLKDKQSAFLTYFRQMEADDSEYLLIDLILKRIEALLRSTRTVPGGNLSLEDKWIIHCQVLSDGKQRVSQEIREWGIFKRNIKALAQGTIPRKPGGLLDRRLHRERKISQKRESTQETRCHLKQDLRVALKSQGLGLKLYEAKFFKNI